LISNIEIDAILSGEILASAGDDGNVLLWTPTDNAAHATAYGKDKSEDVEHWRVKIMCRSNSGAEIYDLAWSPDGKYFITGSMDNVARIHDAQTGTRDQHGYELTQDGR
jgi:chromatin assembly factor 1 subunit B